MGALHFVIPNLFRDLGFEETVVGGAGRGVVRPRETG